MIEPKIPVVYRKTLPDSSSFHATSTDFPDPLPPPVSIVHHSREVFQSPPCISTELLYVGSLWLSYLCSSMWRGPLEYIAYEFVLTSPAVARMSCSSNLDSFRDGEVGGCIAAFLWDAASMSCSISLAAFLCNCRQAFFPYV